MWMNSYQQGDDGRACDAREVLQALNEALQIWRHRQVLQHQACCGVVQNTLRECVQQGRGNLCNFLHLHSMHIQYQLPCLDS